MVIFVLFVFSYQVFLSLFVAFSLLHYISPCYVYIAASIKVIWSCIMLDGVVSTNSLISDVYSTRPIWTISKVSTVRQGYLGLGELGGCYLLKHNLEVFMKCNTL